MDGIQAREALREVRAREQQTLDAASWPWWYVGAIAGLSFAMLALLDLESGVPYLGLCVVGIVVLTERMARQSSVRLHSSRNIGRTVSLALVAALLALYTLVRALLELLLDVPVPSTLAGLAVAAVIVAGARPAQRAVHSTVARTER